MVWFSLVNLKVCHEIFSIGASLNSFIGIVKKANKAKVVVFTCGLDIAQTETKGTVLLKNADEMLNFTRGEEQHMEKVCLKQLISVATCLLLFLDHQRDRSLRCKGHHCRIFSWRACPALPQPHVHRSCQSSFEVRSPPTMSRRQRHTTSSYGRPDT